jgi:ATP-dependent exoDNAse (exonuclease V) alpha subunit
MNTNVLDAQSIALPKNLELSAEMQRVIDLAKAKKNIFITGNAGTGKSTLLTYLRKEVLPENTVVLAPTGVSAINVRGFTIHRFFSFGINVTFEHVNGPDYFARNRGIMRSLETLVIDEISMVRADMLDYVDQALRRFGPKKDKPFGGVQIILIGDLAQLPPIVRGQDERDFISSHYKSEFFFDSHVMQEVEYEGIQLKKIFRQSDPEFISTLNAVRINEAEEHHFDYLRDLVKPDFKPEKEDFYITLTTTNAKADEINQNKLNEIKSPLQTWQARVYGQVSPKDFPTADLLDFKKGAQIMMIANDGEQRWANGTLAVIKDIFLDNGKSGPYVTVKVVGDDNVYDVHLHEWEVLRPAFRGGKLQYDVAGTFTQFPFTLAWAVTIHKSQGKTFDRVILDLSKKAFSPGQLYVALSRCSTPEGLILHHEISADQIMVHDRVAEFTKEMD